jgi:hypothetical protein
MKTQYVLIDHENVQPKDLGLLDGQLLKVIVFLGANQARISTELATKTLANTINALFGKALEENEVQALVAALKQRGVISVKDAKVAYRAADVSAPP